MLRCISFCCSERQYVADTDPVFSSQSSSADRRTRMPHNNTAARVLIASPRPFPSPTSVQINRETSPRGIARLMSRNNPD